ncbi:cell division protein ZapE [Halomonas sp. WWR20]
MTTDASPLAAYQQAILDQGFVPDSAQQHAATLLDECFQALHRRSDHAGQGDPIAGVYLWGPVGRGKTWLMNAFHQRLAVPARRQHFHHFMHWVHRRQFQLAGVEDPLMQLAGELSAEIRVLCLDELFVNDIADAMILGRLLRAMFEQGVVLVTTSNQAPQQLYAEGYNRERFTPAIAAIERHMRVVPLDGGQDHRLHPGEKHQRYWLRKPGQTSALAAVFDRLGAGQPLSAEPIVVGHRSIPVVQRSEHVLWCRYADLCESPLAALDFMALCDRYTHILLGEVPRLGGQPREGVIARGTEDGVARVDAGDRQLPELSRKDDGVRRFIALVDECYDRGIPLYLEADVPLPELYTQGYLIFSFRRALSRLQEMQLARFAVQ